ncbi:pyruvate kinase [Nocardia sp. NPDC005366]|uniref:pyruvate kinase n=1 Tax=Nocardia sp. NPDC005366 TaxID=3156878 RepID=UPI0033BD1959
MNESLAWSGGLADRLDELRTELVAAAADERLPEVYPGHRASAANLAQYVALRQRDIRDLQADLAVLGLSSLGRSEAHVLASVDAVRAVVAALSGRAVSQCAPEPVDFTSGDRLLRGNANMLLGPARSGRRTRIMVTLPTEAADDAGLVDRLVSAGTELVRVNCAHDGRAEWAKMIANVRAAARAQGRHVQVTMDLGGPKVRTGPIRAGAAVVHVKPVRDELGRAVTPARVWLTGPSGPPAVEGVRVPVSEESWPRRRKVGESISFRDARGSARRLVIETTAPEGCLAELADTAYLVPGTELTGSHDDVTVVDDLPRREQKLTLHTGDLLLVVDDPEPVDPTATPARIGCTLPQIFEDARVGQRVFFDDGKFGGVIESLQPGGLGVRITDAAPRGVRLGAGKGMNLPDTTLRLPALTGNDVENLPFVVEHADAVSLSFVRSGADVALLQSHLSDLGGTELGLILKIETVAGFENLPEILFTAMRWPRVGVMIARGDLAVEAGYARLAEVQEEILWLCEAAHVPVIWATQVLDTLARTGRPSRAEVTDAAMSGRAECVMLNKGPFIDHAVTFLDDILTRMAQHQSKKNPLLRQLRSWDDPGPAE